MLQLTQLSIKVLEAEVVAVYSSNQRCFLEKVRLLPMAATLRMRLSLTLVVEVEVA